MQVDKARLDETKPLLRRVLEYIEDMPRLRPEDAHHNDRERQRELEAQRDPLIEAVTRSLRSTEGKEDRSDPAVRDRVTDEMWTDLCELPDRTTPDGCDDMVMLTRQELDDALTAALRTSPPEPASGWMPIETAPKDGTSVLLHWPNIPAGAKSLGSTSKRFTGTSVGWFEASESGVGFVCEGDHAVPLNQEDCTHWQPLPSPPAKEPQ